MKKKKKLILIVGAVLLVALLVVINLKSKGGGDTQVSIEKALKRDLVEKVSATGEIKPKKNINISTDVAGKILKVLVKEGDLVKPGQLLLKVDAAYYEANAERDREVINSSRAELLSQGVQVKKAQQYFLRRQQLFEQGMISKELFEDAQAQLDVAKASQQAIEHQIKQAQASLSSTTDSIKKTYIVSPIEGIVTSLAVEEGEVAIIGTMNNPGTVLMTIADLSVMEAEVLVDETDVVRVKLDKESEVRVDALPDVKMPGRVTEIGNSAVASSSSSSTTTTGESKDFKTVITLDNPPDSLKPGFSATADIIIERKKQVISIPIAAIVLHDPQADASGAKGKRGAKAGKTAEKPGPTKDSGAGKEIEGVWLEKDGKAEFRAVTKGVVGDMYCEIVKGLSENDKVITGPFTALKKLKAGDPVKAAKGRG